MTDDAHDAHDATPEMVDLGPGSFAGSAMELNPPGEVVFSVDPQGQITFVQEALLDEVGTVLWDLVADHAYHGYADETPYEGLSAEDTAWLREVSKEALTPLLKRVAVWVRSGRW
jgi:hypothetical protein